MSSYRVTYEIDVDADSPIKAAKQVHGYMQDMTSYSPVLSVVDDDAGKETVIDLEEVE